MSQSILGKDTVIKTATAIVIVVVAGVVIFTKGVKKGLNKATQVMEAAKTTIKTQREEIERLRRESDESRK